MLKSYCLYIKIDDGTYSIKQIEKDEFLNLCEQNNFVFLGKDVEMSYSQNTEEIKSTDFIQNDYFKDIFGDYILILSKNENKMSLFKNNSKNAIDHIYVFKKDQYFIKYYENKKCIKIVLDE